jgi:hypothetical protein
MALGNITFINGQGASKRLAPGQDYISGLILYGHKPSLFTSPVIQMYSIIDAQNAGILNDYNDETQATASYSITTAGLVGDSISLSVNEPLGVVQLGSFINGASPTPTTVAAGLAAAINAGTLIHGYSATALIGVLTLIARKGLGIFLNTGSPLVVTITPATIGETGKMTGTLTSFSGGVASVQSVWYYHISEYFRVNPNSTLYVGIFAIPTPYTFAEITTIQSFANGTLRQVGIFKSGTYASSDLTLIDGVVKTYNDAIHQPLSVLYAADLSGTADITTIADLSLLTSNKATSIIGQDGAASGYMLFLTTGKSVTHLGVALGLLSLSAVSEDFGEPAKFNISDGVENDVPAFANGQLLSALSTSAINAIDSKRHVFGINYTGYAGTYFNDNHTSISLTSDYAYINDNRTIDKAIRGIYTALVPYLKSRLLKNSDGTLATTTISFLQSQVLAPLYQMARDGDLSTVSTSDVYIDPSQNVTASSLIIINVKLNEDGIDRNIQIPISYK